jgi:peptidoglycan/xylan/chitin deacetylase (PgdA/CDA1 family)
MKGVARNSRWLYALAVFPILFIGFLIMLQPKWILNRLMARTPGVLYAVETEQKLIALTIDDGPDPISTDLILEVLSKHHAHATFFVLIDRINGNESIIKRIVSEGHELGNHLFQDMPSIKHDSTEFDDRLARAHETLSHYAEVRWFRPGSGWYNHEMLQSLERFRYRLVLGSIYPFDAHIPSSWLASRYIVWRADPGAIIVLHDHGSRGLRTAETLAHSLPILKERGYRIVTLSQLLEATTVESD